MGFLWGEVGRGWSWPVIGGEGKVPYENIYTCALCSCPTYRTMVKAAACNVLHAMCCVQCAAYIVLYMYESQCNHSKLSACIVAVKVE